MNKEYADLAVMQPAGSGIALLSAAPQGIGAVGLPGSWCMGAVGFKRPRLVDLGLIQATAGVDQVALTATKPGNPTIRSNYNHMTRSFANGDGGSGPQPLRERPPA
jgi:hypothetical protein